MSLHHILASCLAFPYLAITYLFNQSLIVVSFLYYKIVVTFLYYKNAVMSTFVSRDFLRVKHESRNCQVKGLRLQLPNCHPAHLHPSRSIRSRESTCAPSAMEFATFPLKVPAPFVMICSVVCCPGYTVVNLYKRVSPLLTPHLWSTCWRRRKVLWIFPS